MIDSANGLLLAPNAKSNTVSVFGIDGNTLHLNQVVASGGTLHPIEGSLRSLGLGNGNPPAISVVGGNAFAFVFDPAGQLVIVNAAFGNLSTYNVSGNGTLQNSTPQPASRAQSTWRCRATAASSTRKAAETAP